MAGWVSSLTLVAAIGSGLIAGAFFAFSAFVMKALGNLPAPQGLLAMQRINQDVMNPWFMIPFAGTVLLCLVLAGWAGFNLRDPSATWLLAASVLYAIGCFGVTMAFNVPRNDALAGANPMSPEGAALWTDYLRTWTMWNTVRTLASLAAMICFIAAFRSGA